MEWGGIAGGEILLTIDLSQRQKKGGLYSEKKKKGSARFDGGQIKGRKRSSWLRTGKSRKTEGQSAIEHPFQPREREGRSKGLRRLVEVRRSRLIRRDWRKRGSRKLVDRGGGMGSAGLNGQTSAYRPDTLTGPLGGDVVKKEVK